MFKREMNLVNPVFSLQESQHLLSNQLLLMEEILHRLIGSLSHFPPGVLYIPGGTGFLLSTVGFVLLNVSKRLDQWISMVIKGSSIQSHL